MGMLVDAFNEMAGELQENREVITRSTAELRRSNQALDERRRYIETLLANLSTAVISLDPSGRVTTANPAVEKILGVRLSAGDDATTVLRGKGLDPLGELLVQVQRSEDESVRRDVELPETSPAQQVTVQVSPLKGRSDEDLGSLMMVEDLSDVLRAQKALAWQDVARRIAHEIKNPLTPIQLAAQRLRKKFFAGADDLNQVLLEATASIEREVSGLKHMVDEFSRFARMPQVEPEPVEFGKVVESVLSLYKGLSGIEWQVDLDPHIGWISLDAQQMRRALINLIDNAVAAMNERGTIRISARAVGGNGSVRIEVADSGPGIAPADRDKMFAPYFSTKRRGTGLGLAIVHKVVTDHRGTIRVEDNPPCGVRFVIEIPG
jgi:two-component system nitrogen regulation sensor histidine kinase NtrY